MDFYIVIPAHNEEPYLAKTLQSLVAQTLLPKKIVVVNDHSSDNTQEIINSFQEQYSFISSVKNISTQGHEPGSKVINAFYKGYDQLDQQYDVICKFDADLIFPKNYLARIAELFRQHPKCGMAGGFCYVAHQGEWQLENLTNKDHIRGALKAYRKNCFLQIGRLKKTMGWDTVDELLAQYHAWEIHTDSSLQVKHLKATGSSYKKQAGLKQGEAFKKMRYGFWLTLIASAKLAVKKRQTSYLINSLKGYFQTKEHIVSEDEGKFIRSLRWRNIRRKIF